mgnify:CR=1 FL=1
MLRPGTPPDWSWGVNVYDAFVLFSDGTTEPALDAHRLRADFPVFDELVNGKPVAFLDSAASAQKPRQVLDAIRAAVDTLRSTPTDVREARIVAWGRPAYEEILAAL